MNGRHVFGDLKNWFHFYKSKLDIRVSSKFRGWRLDGSTHSICSRIMKSSFHSQLPVLKVAGQSSLSMLNSALRCRFSRIFGNYILILLYLCWNTSIIMKRSFDCSFKFSVRESHWFRDPKSDVMQKRHSLDWQLLQVLHDGRCWCFSSQTMRRLVSLVYYSITLKTTLL